MDISLAIPLFNEAESLPELTAWIEQVMKAHNYSYEILFINDGSTDGSWQVIESLQKKNPQIKGVKFRRNYGKSPALYTGFQRVQGDVVITMDADLQDSPDEIPELYRMITEEGYDLVSGWKKKRYDPLSKTIPTKIYNATARKVSGIYLHDFNCGLKAYRNEVVKNIEVYGDMHRYKRLSRFNDFMVFLPFRSETHAFFRIVGKFYVRLGLYSCHYSRYDQVIQHVFGQSLSSDNRFTIFLFVAHRHDIRNSTISGRFYR